MRWVKRWLLPATDTTAFDPMLVPSEPGHASAPFIEKLQLTHKDTWVAQPMKTLGASPKSSNNTNDLEWPLLPNNPRPQG